MSSKGKKSFPLYLLGTVFCSGILFILVVSNIIYLLDISLSCAPAINDSPPQNWNREEANAIEIPKESIIKSQDIVSNPKPLKVVIGIVVCHTPDDLSPREEALVLLKSTIISAVIYQTFPINIEFHLFLEHSKDKDYFVHNIHPLFETLDEIQVDIYFYSASNSVPKERQNLVFDSGVRCTYVRLFFPSALPEVDSILYLDTDIIITGSLPEIWDNFYKMDDLQLVGAVMDIEPDNEPWLVTYSEFFDNSPVPTPRGLNAGVLLMNLTKMREFQFEDKMMRLFEDYKMVKNDQKLLNTLLFYNPYLLYLLPCQFNFRHTACSLGFYCEEVKNDPTGIQVMHSYQTSNILGVHNAFRDVAEAYENITRADMDLRENLLIKVRGMYKEGYSSVYDHGKCNGVLDKFLFRKFFL